MANVLQYAQIFQEQLDKQVLAGATSSWMEGYADLVQYNGGNTVKIPKIAMDGLGNYDRTNGFVGGSATLDYETKTFTQDRGRTFSLDAMDVNETNFVANASTLMSEFQRTQVIPEIDAYRYSKIASLAIGANKASGGYTPAVADILTKLRSDIAALKDVIGEVPMVVTMSSVTANILSNSSEVTKYVTVDSFNGNVNQKVKYIDGCPIIEVPSARLKTAYVFNDGKTAGQEAGGFVIAGGAKSINWIICCMDCCIAISKTDKMRIFSPDVNQDADAWKLDYRKYHDLWIPDNKLATSCFVNVKEALV